MDDDSCVMKLIEIVPVDNNRNCSESADIKLSPCHIKVSALYIFPCVCLRTFFMDELLAYYPNLYVPAFDHLLSSSQYICYPNFVKCTHNFKVILLKQTDRR